MQTSYSQTPPAAVEGLPGDVAQCTIEAFTNVEGAAIPAGTFVTRGANDGEMELPDAAGDITGGGALGFIVHQGMHLNPNGITNTGRSDIQDKESGPVMRQGKIWVKCETAFAKGGQVYVRHTVGATADLTPGRVRNDADTNKASALQFARFENTGSSGGWALVRFNVLPA